jgi:hypothetical protein
MHRALEQRNDSFKITRCIFADHGYSFDAELQSELLEEAINTGRLTPEHGSLIKL